MDDLHFGDYVNLDKIQVAPEVADVVEAIRSEQPRLEYFAQYRLHCAVYLDVWNTTEGHASVFVILVRKKTEETTSCHVSLTQTAEVLDELNRFIHKLAQDLMYREKECQVCKTKHFGHTCIRLQSAQTLGKDENTHVWTKA